MAVPESSEVRKAWLAEQVAKVPGAVLRSDGSRQSVWAVEYQPADGGTLRVVWWLRPGSVRDEPSVMLMSSHRTLCPLSLRHVGALSIALSAWLAHEPRPPATEP